MYTCVINQVADKGSLLFALIAANILNTSFETVIGLIRIHEVLWREIILSRWTFDDLFFLNFNLHQKQQVLFVFFSFCGFFGGRGGSKSTLRLIFMVVTTTYYEVLISDVDQYFIFIHSTIKSMGSYILSISPTSFLMFYQHMHTE